MNLTELFDRLLDNLVGLDNCCEFSLKTLCVLDGVFYDCEYFERLSAKIQWGSAYDEVEGSEI